MWVDLLIAFHTELLRNNEIERISREFKRLQINSDKIHYAETLIRRYNKIFVALSAVPVHTEKNDSTSVALRVEGNDLHKQGKYVEALKSFNKSICFAASAENIALGYGNRSATLYEMGRFKDCKKNILLAKNTGNLQENVINRLEKREKQCNEQETENGSDADDVELNLSYAAHHKVPFITDRLEIKKEGQHSWIYAKEYLEPGKVIVKESTIPPHFLLKEEQYIHCHFCLKPNANLIPCPNCTFAMFCDKNCMNRANEEFHKWECPIIDLINAFGGIPVASFRLLLKMLHHFGNYKELKNYWKALPRQQVNWFNCDQNNFNFVEHCKVLHSFVHKTDRLPPATLLNAAIATALFKREVLKKSDLKRIFNSDEQKTLFGEVLFLQMLVFSFLPERIIGGQIGLNFKTKFGVTHSVINEMKTSHTPNTDAVFGNFHILYITNRRIMKGEPIQLPPLEGDANVMDCFVREFDELRMQYFLFNMLSRNLFVNRCEFPFF